MRAAFPFRKVFPLLLALGCYAASWTAFVSGRGAEIDAAQRAQTGAVVAAAAILAFPAALLGPLGTGTAAALTLACLAFLANAAGPDVPVLATATAPVLLGLALAFPAPAALGAAVLVHAVVLAALRPHSAWGRELPGAGGAETAALLSIGALVAALGVALRVRERTVQRLRSELERMDGAFRKVADANLDFQTYALFAREEAMENERRRIAGEIHDIVGYTITNLVMLIQAALYNKGGPEATAKLLETARDHANESLQEARRTLATLRTEDAGRPRGANLFLRLTTTFAEVTGVQVRTDFANLPPELSLPTEKILYRVIQEGLTNAFRHGRATEVAVDFWKEDGNVSVRLRDNGASGESPLRDEPERSGIGLAGIRERVEELGGELEAGPVAGGFALRAKVPL